MQKYMWNNQNISLDILMKIEQVVRILSKKLKKPFDEQLKDFYKSRSFRALKNTQSEMWAESAEFIADEFERK